MLSFFAGIALTTFCTLVILCSGIIMVFEVESRTGKESTLYRFLWFVLVTVAITAAVIGIRYAAKL